MKAYALGTLLLVALFLAGCGEQVTDSVVPIDVSTETSTEETIVEETLDVDAVEEDFSPDEEEDDYGDII